MTTLGRTPSQFLHAACVLDWPQVSRSSFASNIHFQRIPVVLMEAGPLASDDRQKHLAIDFSLAQADAIDCQQL